MPTLTWRSLTLAEKMALRGGWCPPGQWVGVGALTRRATRWTTWPGYLAAFQAVRDEMAAQPAWVGQRPAFAACATQYAARHGMPALERAGYGDIRGE